MQCLTSPQVGNQGVFIYSLINQLSLRLLVDRNLSRLPRPSCSKLTMLLVNDSLKFTSSDTQIC